MDYLAHGLWSYGIYNKNKRPLYAVLVGLAPDTFSWGIYMFYRLFTQAEEFGRPMLESIPNWVWSLYGITHSLFVAAGVLGILWLIKRDKFPLFALAWPISILMDIPTHSREFLPTPFLWPVSDWKFPGFSWGNGYFMAANYLAIAAMFVFIYWRKRRTVKK